jgi:hypothetical protein
MGKLSLQWTMILCATVIAAATISSRAAGQTFASSFGDFSPMGIRGQYSSGSSPFRFSMTGESSDPGTQPALPATEPMPASQPAGAATAAAAQSFPLPLLGDEARKRGYDVPLPFGFSPTYTYVQRDIKISDLRIGLNGATPQSVIDFVDIGSHVKVNAGLGRFDAFIFPFLDVYGLVGYLSEETTTSGTATIRLPGPIGLTRKISFSGVTPVEGFLTGLGVTAATGYKQFFAAFDANYSVSDLGFDDHFRALLLTMRTGWNGKIAHVPMRIWTGVQYWDTGSTAASTITLSSGERLSFEADQGPKNPVNMVLGTSAALSRHFGLLFEYGTNFDDMQMVVAGMEVRF